MFKICMTDDIPEREARSFELPNGDTILLPSVMVRFMLTRIFVHIYR